MTPFERISHLVYVLEGGNAKSFADNCGINPSVLSRVRHGKGVPETYYVRILNAYPEVRREWLYSGKGETLKQEQNRNKVLSRIGQLEKEVNRLSALIEKLIEKG